MIRIKTREEIKILRKGGQILAAILDELVQMAQPGVSTGELEARALALIKKANGKPSFKGYAMPNGDEFPTALCTSINEEVVHAPAIPSRILRNGDIIGIDIGMIYPAFACAKASPFVKTTRDKSAGKPFNKFHESGGYFTDMSKTVIVGKVSKDIKKLVDTARECLYAGINQVKPGNDLNDIGSAIQDLAKARGFFVVKDLVGHGVGHEVHEPPQVPNYRIKDKSLENVKLKPGMVLALEPMVNMGTWQIRTAEDGFAIVTEDNSLSAHFEHTVAVTEKGFEILTLRDCLKTPF
ncbi:type I methionyl aminopeptidase [Candidatus Parcubacteria bacterium]|nr:type I methionyl aminopeptidase [Candidatus Parcubacteria bacterium]